MTAIDIERWASYVRDRLPPEFLGAAVTSRVITTDEIEVLEDEDAADFGECFEVRISPRPDGDGDDYTQVQLALSDEQIQAQLDLDFFDETRWRLVEVLDGEDEADIGKCLLLDGKRWQFEEVLDGDVQEDA